MMMPDDELVPLEYLVPGASAIVLIERLANKVVSLRAQVAQMRHLVGYLTDSNMVDFKELGHVWRCMLCHATHRFKAELQHHAECPVTIVRKILASQSATPE